MALGTGTITPVEMNNAYIPFANGGRLTTPWLIGRIEEVDGTLLYQAPTARTCPEPCSSPAGQNLQLATARGPLQYADPVPTLEPGVAWQMSQMLGGVIRSGTGRRAMELGRAGPRRQDRHHQLLPRRLVRRVQCRTRSDRLDRL
jgi:penicillin-binding protein 1A